MNQTQRHTCLHLEDLARFLGLEGTGRRMWVEQDADYLHIIMEWDGEGDRPDGFLEVSPRGYCEITTFDEFRRVQLEHG